MIDAILFEPALTFTAAVGAAAIIAPVLMKPGRFKLLIACIVIAPISPLLAIAWLCGRIIAACDAVERRLPGRRLFAWAADVIATGGITPRGNVIPFNPNRKRTGGKPA